ncbi:blastula protease 10-like, partial [Homarus americanus]|uniref:blastula protease 10-like n=1 Tax=Homarus americanus TaxID=6706 RepID=UPI001C48CFC5
MMAGRRLVPLVVLHLFFSFYVQGEETKIYGFVPANPQSLKHEVFQGDMVLTDRQMASVLEKAIDDLSKRWPEVAGFPYVPYVFGDNNVDKAAVMAGIEHWKEFTCINFEETTNTDQPHLRFVKLQGCYSFVGYLSDMNGQDVSIGDGCESLGIVAHEIGHALGLFHEQSRTDRDAYVQIFLNNIVSASASNFDLEVSANSFGVPYDLTSDMHYGSRDFSRNGQKTIATLDPYDQELIGNRNGLTHMDKKLVNIIYSCIDKWLANCPGSPTVDPCQNHGYTGKDCTCVCPSGTTGATCETITGDYYDSARSSCSQRITSTATIQVESLTAFVLGGFQCSKVINAPQCMLPKVTFTNFIMRERSAGNFYCSEPTETCCIEGLEIILDTSLDGTWYCGSEITAGQSFTATGRRMVLYTFLFNRGFSWSATVEFVDDPACITSTTTTTTTTT